jgi:hypothetical protein
MSTSFVARRCATTLLLAGLVGVLAGCATMKGEETGQQVRLSGDNEVPPVSTTAYGTGTVNIGADRSVSVTLSVLNMTPTAAHIHEGAAGANGPVIVPLNKISDMAFAAPDTAKLTDAQYAAYKAGNLYLNVHSAKNPGGEIRAQLVGR